MSCQIFDSGIAYNKCKKSANILIGGLFLCNNHARLKYNKYIIIIQKHMRGYKARRIINNIYIRLPKDLQNIILYKINEPVYYRKYCKKLSNIINNKTEKLYSLKGFYNTDKVSIDEFKYIFYLNLKYNSIICSNQLKYLYIIAEELLELLYCLISEIPIDTNIYVAYLDLNSIQSFETDIALFTIQLKNYKNMYLTKYNTLVN